MSTEAANQSGAGCPQHPDVLAQYVCARCQTAVCVECCFSLPDGTICCKPCWAAANQPVAPVATAAPATRPFSLRVASHQPKEEPLPGATTLPPGAGCVQHPNVPPVAFCKSCGAGSCGTCDFVFPGNLHICPVCAGSSDAKLSPRRKKYLITSFVLAAWSTVAFVGFFVAAAMLGESDAGTIVIEIICRLAVLYPSVIGTALGMSVLRKGASNPMSAWLAIVWNALLLGGLLVLIIIGSMMG